MYRNGIIKEKKRDVRSQSLLWYYQRSRGRENNEKLSKSSPGLWGFEVYVRRIHQPKGGRVLETTCVGWAATENPGSQPELVFNDSKFPWYAPPWNTALATQNPGEYTRMNWSRGGLGDVGDVMPSDTPAVVPFQRQSACMNTLQWYSSITRSHPHDLRFLVLYRLSLRQLAFTRGSVEVCPRRMSRGDWPAVGAHNAASLIGQTPHLSSKGVWRPYINR